jgi:hypothetical protein
VWKYNGAVVSQVRVRETVERLGIQINNLCTFLPQEKVRTGMASGWAAAASVECSVVWFHFERKGYSFKTEQAAGVGRPESAKPSCHVKKHRSRVSSELMMKQ